MRVLAITPHYPPASLVGAWLATHKFLRHLVVRGHEVTAFAYGCSTEGWDLDGVKVETARNGLVGAIHLAMDGGADVIISHVGDGGQGRHVAQHKTVGVPNVQLIHGTNVPPVLDDHIALLVFNSHWKRERTPHDFPSIVVPPPTDPAEYATTPGDAITLVSLSEPKGGRLFDQLSRSMPHRHFLGVVGAYGSQMVPNRDNVHTQPTTPNMRDDVYAKTRVLLMPSAYETWGMTGIEAMCSGIPVIAHPCEGLLESLGGAGIFVDRADPQGWMDAIERLDDPDEYAAASQRALDRVEKLNLLAGLDVFAEAVEKVAGVEPSSTVEAPSDNERPKQPRKWAAKPKAKPTA